MYRFINSDLLQAQTYLKNFHSVASKDTPSLGVAYGLAARFWLELGSRFSRYPEDLAAQVEHETDEALSNYPALGITTATECFRNAADYARKAINEGYTPTTRTQWYDKSSGFNTPIDSWMWAIIISPENWMAKSCTWKSWVSYHCPEATYGMSEATEYAAYRLSMPVCTQKWMRTTGAVTPGLILNLQRWMIPTRRKQNSPRATHR